MSFPRKMYTIIADEIHGVAHNPKRCIKTQLVVVNVVGEDDECYISEESGAQYHQKSTLFDTLNDAKLWATKHYMIKLKRITSEYSGRLEKMQREINEIQQIKEE